MDIMISKAKIKNESYNIDKSLRQIDKYFIDNALVVIDLYLLYYIVRS